MVMCLSYPALPIQSVSYDSIRETLALALSSIELLRQQGEQPELVELPRSWLKADLPDILNS